MHTAICTFEDRALAQQAVDRLLEAGFDRREVHLEQRHADGTPMGEVGAGERRDQDVKGKFSFFERLFGGGKHAPHAQTYASAVDRGLFVVLVEAASEPDAERAQNVLHGMEARDLNLVHRAGERPLRELIAEREASAVERSFGTARGDMSASHNAESGEARFFQPEPQQERAMASQGWGEQRRLEVVEDDKPIASPELPLGEGGDKPR
ncbi:hypothetical protein [Ramlibacter sp.]|uniref:hypothetical protein n=1 Tax=Ramlibacter sp. TaxID=1917967 RepID=UPI00262CB777|nr:hypothetical protein [Ramlibacter sp.]MDB5956035.1 hypothetical protein [Ramlibacter sp.]